MLRDKELAGRNFEVLQKLEVAHDKMRLLHKVVEIYRDYVDNAGENTLTDLMLLYDEEKSHLHGFNSRLLQQLVLPVDMVCDIKCLTAKTLLVQGQVRALYELIAAKELEGPLSAALNIDMVTATVEQQHQVTKEIYSCQEAVLDRCLQHMLRQQSTDGLTIAKEVAEFIGPLVGQFKIGENLTEAMGDNSEAADVRNCCGADAVGEEVVDPFEDILRASIDVLETSEIDMVNGFMLEGIKADLRHILHICCPMLFEDVEAVIASIQKLRHIVTVTNKTANGCEAALEDAIPLLLQNWMSLSMGYKIFQAGVAEFEVVQQFQAEVRAARAAITANHELCRTLSETMATCLGDSCPRDIGVEHAKSICECLKDDILPILTQMEANLEAARLGE